MESAGPQMAESPRTARDRRPRLPWLRRCAPIAQRGQRGLAPAYVKFAGRFLGCPRLSLTQKSHHYKRTVTPLHLLISTRQPRLSPIVTAPSTSRKPCNLPLHRPKPPTPYP